MGVASAILAPHDEENKASTDFGGTGGMGGNGAYYGGGGNPTSPGSGLGANNPGPGKPYIPPSTQILPGVSSTSAVPPPAPAPPPPAPDDKKIAAAEKKVDEETQHGFAANILAGGMFQAPPELARNILLGN